MIGNIIKRFLSPWCVMHRGLFPLGVPTDCSLSHADFADDAESFLFAGGNYAWKIIGTFWMTAKKNLRYLRNLRDFKKQQGCSDDFPCVIAFDKKNPGTSHEEPGKKQSFKQNY